MTSKTVAVPVEIVGRTIAWMEAQRAVAPFVSAQSLHESAQLIGELQAAPQAPVPSGEGEIWTALRSEFVKQAEKFCNATRYEEASSIADDAARRLQALSGKGGGDGQG